jgi:hypothetical protein
MPILHKEYVHPAQRSPSGACLSSDTARCLAMADIEIPIPWNIELSGSHLRGCRNHDSGSFTGSSRDLAMNLGRCPDNYLRVRKKPSGIAGNCAFWASLTPESERQKGRLAGGVGRAGIQCRPFRSFTSPRFLSFRLLMRQRSRDRSNRAA